MPTTIPYSPSLVLGSIVHPAAMETLLAMSAVQTPIDVAQDTLNSFISLKHSLTMTVDELLNMNINPKDLVAKIADVDVQLDKAATAYATTRIEQELKMQPLRAKVQQVIASVESPIDYNRTAIKPIDLAGDSLKMDAQYFSFDENNQSAENTVDTIRKFISASGGVGGYQAAAELADSAVKQINRQRQMHKVAGTLVLTALLANEALALRERSRMPLVFQLRAAPTWLQTLATELPGQLAGAEIALQQREPDLLELRCPREHKMRVLAWLANAELSDLQIHEPSLEDVYFGLREAP